MLVILIVFNHTLNCDVSLPAVPQQDLLMVFLFPHQKYPQLHMQSSGLTAHISLCFKALQTQITWKIYGCLGWEINPGSFPPILEQNLIIRKQHSGTLKPVVLALSGQAHPQWEAPSKSGGEMESYSMMGVQELV